MKIIIEEHGNKCVKLFSILVKSTFLFKGSSLTFPIQTLAGVSLSGVG